MGEFPNDAGLREKRAGGTGAGLLLDFGVLVFDALFDALLKFLGGSSKGTRQVRQLAAAEQQQHDGEDHDDL